VLATILAIGIAPFTEELFFRGLLYRTLRDHHGVTIAVIVSSVVFGLVHVTLAPWLDVVLLQSVMVFTGIGLAWIYERRGLVASVAAHTVFNVIGVVLIFTWS
jgi:membrane protease YdiL (CAAX protease family)